MSDTSYHNKSQKPILKYCGVSKTYGEGPGAVTAVKNFSLDINEGEFISIVGPSGCGKSTLIHMTCGLLEPTKSEIRFDDIKVSSPEFQQNNIGLVFQAPVLLEWKTVLKNVVLPAKIMLENGDIEGEIDEYIDRAYDLLEMVGLHGFEDEYPRELSGGMQQRVAICRSLIHDPDVLVMDEPFGALDAFTRDKLNEELLRIWEETGKTIIFVTHDLDEAVFLADRVVVLTHRPGRIKDVIEVGLDRPRTDETRTKPQYHSLVTRANNHFRGEQNNSDTNFANQEKPPQ